MLTLASVDDWKDAMRVVRYLKGTASKGLVYNKYGNHELKRIVIVIGARRNL